MRENYLPGLSGLGFELALRGNARRFAISQNRRHSCRATEKSA